MPNVDYSELFPLINGEVSGADDAVVEQATRQASREFFRKTGVWTEALADIPTGPSIAEYDIPTSDPKEYLVHRISSAVHLLSSGGETLLQPAGTGQMAGGIAGTTEDSFDLVPRGDWRSKSGTPRYYTHDAAITKVRLVPFPTIESVGTLRIVAVIAPTRRSTGIPSEHLERYDSVIAAGARYLLKRVPDRTWSDPQGSYDDLRVFRDGIAHARSDALRSNTSTKFVVSPPFRIA